MASTINASTTSGIVQTADTSGVLELQTANTTVVTVNASQNVGIGTSSPGSKLQVSGIVSAVGSGTSMFATGEIGIYTLTGVTSPNYGIAYGTLTGRPNPALTVSGYDAIAFGTNQAERMRIDSSGNLLVGCTTAPTSGVRGVQLGNTGFIRTGANTTGGAGHIAFNNPNGEVGLIATSGTSTSYNTSSDYRLKENIAPMTGALATVSALKPVTYTWKADGSASQGFIAHELQAIVPDCVTGEKDAVDAEGNPVYQGIDTSFLVATLTAAIQEQQTIINDLKSRIEVLENK